jgi:hypothetical protein
LVHWWRLSRSLESERVHDAPLHAKGDEGKLVQDALHAIGDHAKILHADKHVRGLAQNAELLERAEGPLVVLPAVCMATCDGRQSETVSPNMPRTMQFSWDRVPLEEVVNVEAVKHLLGVVVQMSEGNGLAHEHARMELLVRILFIPTKYVSEGVKERDVSDVHAASHPL